MASRIVSGKGLAVMMIWLGASECYTFIPLHGSVLMMPWIVLMRHIVAQNTGGLCAAASHMAELVADVA